jgi:pimeloyl-ACP methyl ester carboxylesterase
MSCQYKAEVIMTQEPRMHRAFGSGVDLALAEWEGEEPSLLCIHGLTANCRCWDGLAASLTPRHRVLGVDLRGRGHSEAPDSGYSLDHHCRDIHRVLEEWRLGQGVLMGHSLGAAISLAFGAAHPDRVGGLILVDGGGKLEKEQMDTVLQGIAPSLERLGRTYASTREYLEEMRRSPHFQPWNEVCEAYFRHEIEAVQDGVRCRIQPEHIREEVENLRQVDIASFYGRIACPVLILRAGRGLLGGEQGLLLPQNALKRMQQEMDRAECVELEDADHYSIVFQPSPKRDRAILDFLGRI